MTDREAFEAWWIPLNYTQVSENIAWLACQAALASERAKQAVDQSNDFLRKE